MAIDTRNLSKAVAALLAAGSTSAAILLTMVPENEGTKFAAYRDPVGIMTICSGSTGNVRAGDIATPQECSDRTMHDINVALATVRSCVTHPMNPNQEAAFADFALNVGPGGRGVKDGFCHLESGNTPTFLKKFNAGDATGGCNGLLQWIPTAKTPAQYKVRDGLAARRYTEVAVCLYPYQNS